MADYTTMTDEELVTISSEVMAEQSRRYQVTSIPEQMAVLNVQYLGASGVESGEPWVQPTGAHDAYPLDWVVSHNGSNWRSLIAANVWEPGVSGWAVDGGGEWPMWFPPTGGHDAYPAGAKVAHIELHWISDVDANVWEPGVYGWTESV